MRRISYWVLSTVSTVVLLFSYHPSTSGALATGASSSQQAVISSASSTSGSSTSSATSSAGTSSTASGSSSSSTKAKTKATASTVTGSVAQTQWGPVQVQLTVSGGKITKVSVLQYPSGNGKDAEINSYALPILVQETVDAQSASIDMVSGATVTSGGYLQSLQSALDQANL